MRSGNITVLFKEIKLTIRNRNLVNRNCLSTVALTVGKGSFFQYVHIYTKIYMYTHIQYFFKNIQEDGQLQPPLNLKKGKQREWVKGMLGMLIFTVYDFLSLVTLLPIKN